MARIAYAFAVACTRGMKRQGVFSGPPPLHLNLDGKTFKEFLKESHITISSHSLP
jgi:hypothetical protein